MATKTKTPPATPAPDARALELAHVKPSKTNRKHFDQAKFDELAASIREHGVLQAILVRPTPVTAKSKLHSGWKGTQYEIVCGERRYRAAKHVGLKTIPAIVRELSDAQALEAQLIENIQREDVHPIDEAEGYDELQRTHGLDVDTIAARCGKSVGYVYGRLKLLALEQAHRDAFRAGKLDAAVALVLARVPAENGLQAQAFKAIQPYHEDDEPLTFRQASRTIREKYMRRLADAPFDTASMSLVPEAGACLVCPKRTGNQSALFADVDSPDVCSDPTCYTSKLKAEYERVLAEGPEHVTEYSGKAFDQYGHLNDRNLIDVSGPAWHMDYTLPRKPIRDLLKREIRAGELRLQLAVDEDGGPVYLAKRADVKALLVKSGKLKKERATSSSSSGAAKPTPAARHKAAKIRARAKAVNKALPGAVAEVVAAATKAAKGKANPRTAAQLERIIAAQIMANGVGGFELWARHGVKTSAYGETPSKRQRKAFDQVAKLKRPQLLALILDSLLHQDGEGGAAYYAGMVESPEPSVGLQEAAKLFGVDLEGAIAEHYVEPKPPAKKVAKKTAKKGARKKASAKKTATRAAKPTKASAKKPAKKTAKKGGKR